MEPTSVPPGAETWYPNMRKLNVGKPGYKGQGDDGDGSSVREAATLQALYGNDPENGWPHFREFWEVPEEEVTELSKGGLIMLTFWVPQMPVHSMQIVDKESAEWGQ